MAHQQPPQGVPAQQKETALSLQRPPVAWPSSDNNPARQKRKNTAVLVAVALLTAVCVAAIAALIWLKIRASSPAPDKATPDAGATTNTRTLPTASTDSAATSAPGHAASALAIGATASASAQPGDAGFLTVICKPFCDTVKRDKDSLGPSPIVKSPTTPGHHQITMSRTGCPDHVESVTIAAGEVRVLHVNMP